MSDIIISIPAMDDLFDLPIFLSTVIVFVLGHTAHSFLRDKKRSELALLQREEYFQKLTQDFMKMDEEVKQKLRSLEERRCFLVAELRREKLPEVEILSDSLPDEKELRRTIANLESVHRQLEEYEKEISETSRVVGLADSRDLDKLQRLIKQLEEQNEELKSQIDNENAIGTQNDRAIQDQNQDPDLLAFLEKDDYSTDKLNELYEFLLEIQARGRDRDLDDYLASIEQTKNKYATELTELDVKRKSMELSLRQTRQLYEEELGSFNESRVEYLFKITGAREWLTQLEERNEIIRKINGSRVRVNGDTH